MDERASKLSACGIYQDQLAYETDHLARISLHAFLKIFFTFIRPGL